MAFTHDSNGSVVLAHRPSSDDGTMHDVYVCTDAQEKGPFVTLSPENNFPDGGLRAWLVLSGVRLCLSLFYYG
jgi:hypothetical protein